MLYAALAASKQYLKWPHLPEQLVQYSLLTSENGVKVMKTVVPSYFDVRENEGYLSDPM